MAASPHQLEEVRPRAQRCWARSVHRYVRDHDFPLQEHLAAAAHRCVETEHVGVEWTNGGACCHVEERRWDANENETGGMVAFPL